jgi:hypothetical protein
MGLIFVRKIIEGQLLLFFALTLQKLDAGTLSC